MPRYRRAVAARPAEPGGYGGDRTRPKGTGPPAADTRNARGTTLGARVQGCERGAIVDGRGDVGCGGGRVGRGFRGGGGCCEKRRAVRCLLGWRAGQWVKGVAQPDRAHAERSVARLVDSLTNEQREDDVEKWRQAYYARGY